MALIVYELVSILALKAVAIVPIGLALIVYELVSVLTLKAVAIVPIGLALIVYELMSVLTLKAVAIVPIGLALIVYEIVSDFDIDSKVKLSCTWTDMGLRNPYKVGNLLHTDTLQFAECL